MKRCAQCKELKSKSEFHKHNNAKDGLKCYCKSCSNARQRGDHVHDNPAFLNRRMLRKYGITLEEYNVLFLKQEGKCAICGVYQKDLSKRLYVDHDHKTGIIRGLLCYKCNTGLGQFNDNIKLIENTLNYLRGKLKCEFMPMPMN